jgi:hypothetical protein
MAQATEIVAYRALVDLAHQKGLVGIETEIVQIPTPDNNGVAIFHATVRMSQEGVEKCYQGTGDASPANVRQDMAIHLIRLAETRAKARALRDAVNLEGQTAVRPYEACC